MQIMEKNAKVRQKKIILIVILSIAIPVVLTGLAVLIAFGVGI